jgi:two-component system, NtrC family, sensor histidine kinase KinB
MNPPSLRSSIRNGTLAMLGIAIVLGGLALPEIHRLGGAIRDTLHRNYVSIDAAQHMNAALWLLQLAARDGKRQEALKSDEDSFDHWIDVEQHDITEVGEGPLAGDINQRGRKLFAELANPAQRGSQDDEFAALHSRVDDLIKLNSDAMFRADGRASRMGVRLTSEFAAGLGLLLIIGIALSWTMAWNITKPLGDLADRLRSFSLRGPSTRLHEQPLAELQTVASEFNKMAERLEHFEKLNIDRLIYEKSKTEAIIDSVEDGIVLIDPKGTVTHINEIAAIILGVEREDALGNPFDDLNSHHPHYLRIRTALRKAAKGPEEATRIEVELYVRGRDHTYLLKPIPLRRGDDNRTFGTILTLQDITYLRDQDRARANLVATLSHELKTPLTSIALSTGLLERKQSAFGPEEQKLVGAIAEDIDRIRHLADDLLNLARGASGSIAIRSLELDLGDLVKSVVKTFALQAEHKSVNLRMNLPQSISTMRGDPIKLSWVVSNLLANALRYTPEHGSISLSLEEAGNGVSLKVRDNGPGIPPQIRNRLFERFTKWSINGTAEGSAGLGLAIVKEIVEAHGGRIFVDTTEGMGTCFTVDLPVRQEGSWLSC